MDVLVLIDKLDDLVHNARPIPFSDSVRVDKEEIYDILDQMRAPIPEEIKQARWIVKERQEMLAEAKREAERVVKEAREEQIQLISEEEIVKQAERQAEEIVEDARAREREIRLGAEDYADGPDRAGARPCVPYPGSACGLAYVRGALQDAREPDDRQRAQERWQPELEGTIGEHGGDRGGQRRAVERERRDQPAVGAANASRQRDQAAELADDVREGQHAERRRGPDGREGGGKRSEVERHVAGGAGDHQRAAGAHQRARVSDAGAERRAAFCQHTAHPSGRRPRPVQQPWKKEDSGDRARGQRGRHGGQRE